APRRPARFIEEVPEVDQRPGRVLTGVAEAEVVVAIGGRDEVGARGQAREARVAGQGGGQVLVDLGLALVAIEGDGEGEGGVVGRATLDPLRRLEELDGAPELTEGHERFPDQAMDRGLALAAGEDAFEVADSA